MKKKILLSILCILFCILYSSASCTKSTNRTNQGDKDGDQQAVDSGNNIEKTNETAPTHHKAASEEYEENSPEDAPKKIPVSPHIELSKLKKWLKWWLTDNDEVQLLSDLLVHKDLSDYIENSTKPKQEIIKKAIESARVAITKSNSEGKRKISHLFYKPIFLTVEETKFLHEKLDTLTEILETSGPLCKGKRLLVCTA